MLARIKDAFSEHPVWIWAVLFALLNAPLVYYIQEVILLNQDYNPVFLSRLFSGDITLFHDDAEIGANAKYLMFSSLFFYLSHALSLAGLPIETLSAAAVVVNFPLFFAGLYFLSWRLFGNKQLALVSAFMFPAMKFMLFDMNIGYPALYFHSLYYGDINHTFAVWIMVACLASRYAAAAGLCGVLILLNPTYGLQMGALSAFVYIAAGQWRDIPGTLKIAAVGLVCLAAALCQIHLATPVSDPAPLDQKIFSIQTYSHMVPHILDVKNYIAAQIFLLLGLAAALCIAPVRERPQARLFLYALLAYHLLFGIVLYAALYYFLPQYFVYFSPARAYIFTALVTGVSFTAALWYLFSQRLWLLVTAHAVFFAYPLIGPAHVINSFAKFCVAGSALFAVLLLLKNRMGAFAALDRRALLGVAFALFLASCAHLTWVANGYDFRIQTAFLDIQKQISAHTPPESKFAPYTVAPNDNPYAMFRSWPFRTYSGRSAMTWVVGRNAYFDSALRSRYEEEAFKAAGLSLWPDMLARGEAVRRDRPLYYFTGLHRDADGFHPGPAGIWVTFLNKIDIQVKTLDAMSLNQFMDFARRLHVTHLIVSQTPGHPFQGRGKIVLRNDYFVVLDISR